MNPLQFGPLEDFDRYPRPLEQDLAVCASEGVQAVFAPGRAVMYPAEPAITVNPGELGRRLEGKSRPGFFDGVLTVVLKLLELTKPDVAVFGEKDAQQLALIRRMVADLDLGVQIAGAPLHRDGDGLASSSRNGYLSAAERISALALSHALAAARAAAAGGAAAALQAGRQVLDAAAAASPPVQVDYFVLAEPDGLTEVGSDYTGPACPADRGQGRPDQADRQRACERRRAAGSRARPRQADRRRRRWCGVIAGKLLAPEPGWRLDADVVVVGSGVAGVTAVLSIRRSLPDARILLVTKSVLDDGSTRWAQGGIAAALGPGDSPEQHLADTLTAGAGVCDTAAVRALVTDGPDAVRRLIATGAEFDREPAGPLALTREGGHLRRRIAHAGGDATGAEISRALLAALTQATAGGGLQVIEHALALDLLRTADGRAAGITLHVLGEGQQDGVGAVHARAVVLATGGFGQVFAATTNPPVSTGDGLALALRAGAEAADLEFIQFHPTVLWLGPDSHGRQPLISEAVRGEGAFLVDGSGRRFMTGLHPLADLAPRDVVAKAIMRVLLETATDHVYLDGRHLGADVWQHRFPTIQASCREHGIDPVSEVIPVVPAAHYASGGVRTDLRGRTSVPGLYACGETACTGVHGANRLASNSLLEGLVFAERIAADLAAGLPPSGAPGRGPAARGAARPGGRGPVAAADVGPGGRAAVRRRSRRRARRARHHGPVRVRQAGRGRVAGDEPAPDRVRDRHRRAVAGRDPRQPLARGLP